MHFSKPQIPMKEHLSGMFTGLVKQMQKKNTLLGGLW